MGYDRSSLKDATSNEGLDRDEPHDPHLGTAGQGLLDRFFYLTAAKATFTDGVNRL